MNEKEGFVMEEKNYDLSKSISVALYKYREEICGYYDIEELFEEILYFKKYRNEILFLVKYYDIVERGDLQVCGLLVFYDEFFAFRGGKNLSAFEEKMDYQDISSIILKSNKMDVLGKARYVLLLIVNLMDGSSFEFIGIEECYGYLSYQLHFLCKNGGLPFTVVEEHLTNGVVFFNNKIYDKNSPISVKKCLERIEKEIF